MQNWNSKQYIKFEKERTQPSVDLIHKIDITPKTVLDIGCGPGNSTNQLYKYFPKADILGIDSSDNMLEKANKSYADLKFKKCTIPDELDEIGSFDLIFSNACLHWIPDHSNLFPMLMDKLNIGGVLAVQMPLIQNAMFYETLNKFVTRKKWNKLQNLNIFYNLPPNALYDILSEVSSDITMWDTTYYHIVPSHKSVIDWYKGSGLRPYLNQLTPSEQDEFLSELLDEIKNTFPTQADNSVILKMPRLFFTAKK